MYLVTGIPGAGKTTVSRELAGRLGPAAHLEGDAIGAMVISGGLLPGQEPLAESGRQLLLRTRNIGLLADSFFAAGITPIIDDVVVGRRLADFTALIRSRPLLLVVLAPSVEVALARDRLRPDKTVADRWAHVDGEMRRDLAGAGLWIDTDSLTVAQTVDVILARAAAEGSP